PQTVDALGPGGAPARDGCGPLRLHPPPRRRPADSEDRPARAGDCPAARRDPPEGRTPAAHRPGATAPLPAGRTACHPGAARPLGPSVPFGTILAPITPCIVGPAPPSARRGEGFQVGGLFGCRGRLWWSHSPYAARVPLDGACYPP